MGLCDTYSFTDNKKRILSIAAENQLNFDVISSQLYFYSKEIRTKNAVFMRLLVFRNRLTVSDRERRQKHEQRPCNNTDESGCGTTDAGDAEGMGGRCNPGLRRN